MNPGISSFPSMKGPSVTDTSPPSLRTRVVVGLSRPVATMTPDLAPSSWNLAMSDYHLAHAARAELARRAGSMDEARESYRRALELVRQEPERRYLERRLAQIPE